METLTKANETIFDGKLYQRKGGGRSLLGLLAQPVCWYWVHDLKLIIQLIMYYLKRPQSPQQKASPWIRKKLFSTEFRFERFCFCCARIYSIESSIVCETHIHEAHEAKQDRGIKAKHLTRRALILFTLIRSFKIKKLESWKMMIIRQWIDRNKIFSCIVFMSVRIVHN